VRAVVRALLDGEPRSRRDAAAVSEALRVASAALT
jgi:hypothetical protein